MKLHTLLLSTLLVTSAISAENNSTEPLTVKQEGIKYIKMLGGALKTELKAHMMADKTGLSAAGFCTTKATSITKEINAKLPKYAKVRRTALKLRNDINNSADIIDDKIMNDYMRAIEDKTFKPTDIKMIADGKTTRIYKPLITKPVCLKCHGSNISKEINKVITSAYPNDKAIDFKEGSLRGVIVAEITEVEKTTKVEKIIKKR